MLYIPPDRGAALARVGAATRGPRPDLGSLQALAPDHVGLTTSPQPRLFWYLGETSATRVDVTLIDDVSAQPLVELVFEPPVAAGFHVLDCEAHAVTLAAGKTYQWFVAYVPDPARRSRDVIASGAVMRVSRPDRGDPADAVALARQGLWYDAVMAAREAGDGARSLAALQSLAEQVGLNLRSLD